MVGLGSRKGVGSRIIDINMMTFRPDLMAITGCCCCCNETQIKTAEQQINKKSTGNKIEETGKNELTTVRFELTPFRTTESV